MEDVKIHGVDAGDDSDQPFKVDEGRMLTKPSPITGGAADLFSGPGDGTIVDLQSRICHRFAIQVRGDAGDPNAWEVQLLARLSDNMPWDAVLTHSTADGIGKVKGGTFYPASHILARVISLDSSHNLRVTILATG